MFAEMRVGDAGSSAVVVEVELSKSVQRHEGSSCPDALTEWDLGEVSPLYLLCRGRTRWPPQLLFPVGRAQEVVLLGK